MNGKKKIGLISSPNISPNENAVLFNLGRMVQKEFELHLLCGQNSDYNNLFDYYNIHSGKVYRKDFGDFRYAVSICARYVKELNLDLLINVCSPATLGYVATIFARKHNIPSIIRMTGDSFKEAQLHNKLWKRFKSWMLHGQMAASAYKKANYILAIGENLRTELIRHNYDPEKVFVLPQPFDRSLFSPVDAGSKSQRKLELGLDPNRKTILFVGRISWLKGSDRILKIVEEVGKRSRAFQFCLVGKGEYENSFRQFSPKLVHLPGLIPHCYVSRYFQVADLLIFPSRTEGLPNTILEALSCRVPVIATPVGDISNWVSNLATNPVDYVKFILQSTYVTDKLPDSFNFSTLKQAYIKLFRTIIRNAE